MKPGIRQILAAVIVGSFVSTCAVAAEPQLARFEVASIRPGNNPHATSIRRQPTGGRFTTQNTTLRALLAYAYGVQAHQVTGGPAWIGTDLWDITARPEGEVPEGLEGDARLRQMMQHLLAERFGVAVHNETKDLPVYGLVVAKAGSKMKQVDAPDPAAFRMGMSQFTLVGDISQLISQLIRVTGRSVADETGLKGNYEMKLSWTPDPAQQAQIAAAHGTAPDFAAAEGPSLFTALQEQLGLRLDARKGPVVVYTVDKASKPSEN